MDKVFLATPGSGLARAAKGNNDEWAVTHLLAGQDVRCLAADPHEPGRVYAGLQGQGVMGSTDGGQTWSVSGLAGQVVKTLAVSPTRAGVIYAGTRSPAALYVSDDHGASWHELEGFRDVPGRWWWFSPAEPPFAAYVQGIAPSPGDPDVIVVGIEFGAVIRSADGGRTWTGHRPGALRDCHSLVGHASNADWFYEAGGSGAGAAVSRDGGITWQQSKTGLDRHYGWACAADPAQPEIWYASISTYGSFPKMVPSAHVDGEANAHIFRTVDGGDTWEKLGGGLPQPLDYMAYALIVDPSAPGHLYAGLSNGDVWHTADHGDSWRQLPFNLGGIHRAMITV